MLVVLFVAAACTSDSGDEQEARSFASPTSTEPSRADVYVIDVDGGNVQRLTHHPDIDGTAVVWISGDRIMFSRGQEEAHGTYTMAADGDDVIELLPPDAAHVAGGVTPDGKIIFSSDRSGSDLLYSMNGDGSSVQRLPNTEPGDFFPVPSPDGTEVAFIIEAGTESDIWLMSIDGSDRRPLDTSPLDQKWTTWSPDGKFLAYHHLPTETIRVSNVDKGTRRTLKLDRPALMPAWSRDGKKMAFISEGDVCVASLERLKSRCFEHPAEEFGPAWSPDGSRIAFVSDRS